MTPFKKFLNEGGNIKIGGQAAGPFQVTAKNRQSRMDDIHGALSAIHDTVRNAHGVDIYGKGKKALSTGSAYSGSTRQLMDPKISHERFAAMKKKGVGDVDTLINREHADKLGGHLTKGARFGKYTVVGTSKHGTEHSAVMQHDNGEKHQFDFVQSHYHQHEPSTGDQFLHSSHAEDMEHGVKGFHHKSLIGSLTKTIKPESSFSTAYGIRPKGSKPGVAGISDPKEVSKHLFGANADHRDIHSFMGVTRLIKKHVPADKHQEIVGHFEHAMAAKPSEDNRAAIAHLREHLGSKPIKEDTLAEAVKINHTTVMPMMGASPISHMGHATDIGGTIMRNPGTKHVGISQKADVFTPEERKSIMHRQWGHPDDVHFHVVKSAGETLGKAYKSLPEKGKKHLHIVVGADREAMGHQLKKSIEAGKIPEMEGGKFDKITVHTASADRAHGMSGTRMRQAANNNDLAEFHRHLGNPVFSKDFAQKAMKRVQTGLQTGKITLKRK